MAVQPLSDRETIRASILKSRFHLSQLQCSLHDTVFKTHEMISQSRDLIAEIDEAIARRHAPRSSSK